MNYIETLKGKYLITEQGRSNIRSLLAWKGLSLLSLTLETGWNYQRLYRIVRGMQVISRTELEILDDTLIRLTGFGIIETNGYIAGRVS